MTRPPRTTYLSGVSTRLFASCAPVLVTAALTFACFLPSQAGAQTRGLSARTPSPGARARRVRVHTHGAGAQAHKAACSTTRVKHGSHACSSAKGHKHKAKAEAHHKHAAGARHALSRSKASIPAPAPGGSSAATCSDGVNATLDEEGTFACAGGAEPGCREGFAPVVSGDGSTLVCEPEASEGGEEEG
ncbi:MAG TPA: hypothetical protein VG053_00595 [Solirubrobacteraceae bacterium]|nr:hypothetical protein [Solirubrobacteraceae bacterium]